MVDLTLKSLKIRITEFLERMKDPWNDPYCMGHIREGPTFDTVPNFEGGSHMKHMHANSFLIQLNISSKQ